jgi:hypothetical protein
MRTAILLTALAATVLAAGCLSSPASQDGTAADAAHAAALGLRFIARTPKGNCDAPLLPVGIRPVRSSEVTVATNPANPDELAAVFKVSLPPMRAQAPNDVELWDALARSTDGGATWTFATLHGYPGDATVHQPSLPFYGAAFLSDPVVAFAGDGTLVFAGLIAKAESIDLFAARFSPGMLEPDSVTLVQRGDLRSFHGLEGSPAIVDQVPTPIALVFNDGPHINADPASNAIYLGWGVETVLDPTAADAEGSRSVPAIATSLDAGKTWSQAVLLTPDGRVGDVNGENWGAPRPVVSPDGIVHAFSRDIHSEYMVTWTSADQGNTWTGPVKVIDQLPNNGGEGSYWRNTNPDPGADRSNGPDRGSLYVTWSDTRNGDRDVFLTASRDGGATWSAPLRLNSDPVGDGHDQFYPYMVVEPRSGAIDVAFMDRRNDTEHQTWSVAYLARSVDGGRTFVDMPVATQPTNTARMINEAPDVPLSSYGDYNGITYNADGIVPVWQDGRTGTDTTHYSDVYLCRIATPPLRGQA